MNKKNALNVKIYLTAPTCRIVEDLINLLLLVTSKKWDKDKIEIKIFFKNLSQKIFFFFYYINNLFISLY